MDNAAGGTLAPGHAALPGRPLAPSLHRLLGDLARPGWRARRFQRSHMSTRVLSLADPPPPFDAPATSLSGTAMDELHALRAAFDARYAALEAALENPDACDSLESLVL